EDQYGKGRLFILNVPENFADLYKLPAIVRENIAKHMTIGLPAYLGTDADFAMADKGSRGAGRVSLLQYDNGICGIVNYEERAVNARLLVRGEMYGDDETMWYGDQTDLEPGDLSGAGAVTKTDLSAKKPVGATDILSGQKYAAVTMLPKPAWHLDSTTIIPEPLEYAINIPVGPGGIKFVKL
nr:hypothetical protein [Lachnospiraceae bacterium]